MSSQNMPSLPSKTILWSFAGLLVVLGLLVYGRSLGNDFVRFDDNGLIFENSAVHAMTPANIAYVFTHFDPELYIPLTFVSYQVLYQIGGLNAFVYHAFNLFLHILNAGLVAWLVFVLSKRQMAGALAGVLFLVHPINTEAVAWAASLKDVQSTFFLLSAIITYLYARTRADETSVIGLWKTWIFWLSIGLFLFSIGSKIMAVTLPVILLLIDWKEHRRWSVAMFVEKIPYFIISIIFGLVGLLGKQEIIESTTPWQSALMAMRSTTFYLQKFLIPTDLSVMYPYLGPIQLGVPMFAVSLIILLILAGIVFYSLRYTRDIVFAALVFCISVFPTFLNFSKARDIYLGSDRYIYVPAIGIFYVLALGLAILYDSHSERFTRFMRQRTVLAFVGIFVVAWSFLSFKQSAVWKDAEALFSHIVRLYPDAQAAHNNLGNALRRRGQDVEAVDSFKASLAIRPTGKAHRNLAATYAALQRYAESEAEYNKAKALEPDAEETYFGLGYLYALQGEKDKALAMYQKTLDLNPSYVSAYHNRGSLLYEHGDAEGALENYRKALELEPLSSQTHFNIGVVHMDAGKFNEALEEYETSIDLDPRFIQARLNAGVVYAKVGKLDQSRKHFEAVLRLDPTNASARKAITQIDEALQKQR